MRSGVEIALFPTTQRVLPKDFDQIMQNEYSAKYLESIGATPTKENLDFVINNLPISNAIVLPVWVRDKIIIIPGMKEYAGDLGDIVKNLG
jgi:hypothetical protein